MDDEILAVLEKRMGQLHARQRLGIETEIKPRVFGNGINFFHPENWYPFHSFVRNSLRMVGLYKRGIRNTHKIRIVNNTIAIKHLPEAFVGYRLLHLSDLHVDMDLNTTNTVIQRLTGLEYDICVLTGDYRAQTFGSIQPCIEQMKRVCAVLKPPLYGVLGNHDSIRMVPELENMGMRMLLNEQISLCINDSSIHLAGIDDAHYFRVDNIEKAAESIPHNTVSILLSHTPEIYRQAAHAGFNLMLCGHTHGGQICLPGGIPITLDSRCPRYMGSGNWQYHKMLGYTSTGAGNSVVNVRINNRPEITIHTLKLG